ILSRDLQHLELLAEQVKTALESVNSIENVGIFHIQGQSNLEMRVDRAKCDRYAVSVADVQNVIETAVRGKAFTSMIEGEKTFDITLRLPERLRGSVADILKIPVDVSNNTITPASAGLGVSPTGTSQSSPASAGSATNATYNLNVTNGPRRPLGELVRPVGQDGPP